MCESWEGELKPNIVRRHQKSWAFPSWSLTIFPSPLHIDWLQTGCVTLPPPPPLQHDGRLSGGSRQIKIPPAHPSPVAEGHWSGQLRPYSPPYAFRLSLTLVAVRQAKVTVLNTYFLSQMVFIIGQAAYFMVSTCAGIYEQSMGARNRVGLGLSYRPARLHRLAELVSWNRFFDSLKV